jgi:hypothetical protein
MIVGQIAVFFKMAFNAVPIRYIMRITMALPTQNYAMRLGVYQSVVE